MDDLRESPGLDIIHLLVAQGEDGLYHEPYVLTIDVEGLAMKTVPDLDDALV